MFEKYINTKYHEYPIIDKTPTHALFIQHYISLFKCDIPVVFYKFNMYSVQLAVKTQLINCTVCTTILV